MTWRHRPPDVGSASALVRKARVAESLAGDVADRVAPLYEKTLRAAFDTLRADLADGDVRGLVDPAFLGSTDAFRAFVKDLLDTSQRALFVPLVATGTAAGGRLNFEFDYTSPTALAWAEDHAAELVTNVARVTAGGIRAIVADAFGSQRDVLATSRAILETLRSDLGTLAGLTERDYRAVRAFRDGLREDDPERADAAAAKLADRYRRARAETIARTEILRASNAGQGELWAQAAAAGLIVGAKRIWVLTSDEAVCPICEYIAGRSEASPVPLGEPFVDEAGAEYDEPPAHPNCRCTAVLQLDEPATAPVASDINDAIDGAEAAADEELAAKRFVDAIAKGFDEAAHPRDESGRWAGADGLPVTGDHVEVGGVGVTVTTGPEIGRTTGDPSFNLALTSAGERLGMMMIRLIGTDIHVKDVEAYGGSNTLGPRAVIDTQRALRRLFPAARTISGSRVSGARGRTDASFGQVAVAQLRKALSPDDVRDALRAGAVAVAKVFDPSQERDERGRWVVELDASGFGRVATGPNGFTSYAGVHENEWQDWAYNSANLQDAQRGALRVGDLDNNGRKLTAADVVGATDLAGRIQRAAESHAVTARAVYRGESFASERELLDRYPRGATLDTPMLTSASTDQGAAEQYADEAGGGVVRALVRYGNQNGVPGIQTAPLGVPSNEVVLPRGERYRVARIYTPAETGTGRYVVDLYSTREHGRLRVNSAKPVGKADFDETKYPRDERGRWAWQGEHVYHGTRAEHLASVADRGLTAWPRLWTTTTEEAAAVYAAAEGVEPLVLRVRRDAVHGLRYSGHSRHGGVNEFTETTVPPEHVEIKRDGLWVSVRDAVRKVELRTLYVRRPLLNARELLSWYRDQGVANLVDENEPHVTLAYSTVPLAWDGGMAAAGDHELIVPASDQRHTELLGDEGSVTLRFDDDRLRARWAELVARGAVWRWATYKPHVTICVDPTFDVASVEPWPGELRFGPEVWKEIEGKWRDTKDEVVKAGPPDEPRDDHGRWTAGGGGDASAVGATSALSSFEDEVRDRDTERSAWFKLDGTRVGEKADAQPDRVDDFTDRELRSMRGTVVTHNHPGESTSFSPADVRLAAHARVAEARVVTRDHTYSIKPTEPGSPLIGLQRAFGETAGRWPRAQRINDAFANAQDDVARSLTGDMRDRYAKQRLTKGELGELLHRMWERAAPDLGLIYTRTPRVRKAGPVDEERDDHGRWAAGVGYGKLTPSTFRHPTSNRKLTRTEIGDTFEALALDKAATEIRDYFEATSLARLSGPGNRQAPVDLVTDAYGIEVKTISSAAGSQRTKIKAVELERKYAHLRDEGLKPGLVVQVVDQAARTVDVYGLKTIASVAVAKMDHLGRYRYAARDLVRSGLRKGEDDSSDEVGDLIIELIDGVPHVHVVSEVS